MLKMQQIKKKEKEKGSIAVIAFFFFLKKQDANCPLRERWDEVEWKRAKHHIKLSGLKYLQSPNANIW